MNSDTAKIKANKAWKTLIAKSSYLLMSNKELEEKCKNFFILGYYTAVKDSHL